MRIGSLNTLFRLLVRAELMKPDERPCINAQLDQLEAAFNAIGIRFAFNISFPKAA